ncbi:dUTP diphosphatase [Virgibacillus salexigens]|uniref:dUTP diphosphatase n=1 Tax=Virgibacillus salexigens TaxID=61016 RepID=UPI0030814D6F
MNLNKLMPIQKRLDDHIKDEQNLHGQDLLDKKILSLQVELGEIANELPEVFKFWSHKKNNYERALKEYVDCLHFILSIGLERGYDNKNFNLCAVEGLKRNSITAQFNYLFDKIGDFSSITNHNNYMYIVPLFIGLGEMLGFTWEQIEQAYLNKIK